MVSILNANTKIIYNGNLVAVKKAVHMLERDIQKVFLETKEVGSLIVLKEKEELEIEAFEININRDISILAHDELGFIYGLLYMSEKFLGITPFWFWMDQHLEKVERILLEERQYKSPKPLVKYRGWFVNDEVLIMKWAINGDQVAPWEMVFEALLRCGGNMVIPGTDKNSRVYRKLASDMGLWITHHHAEPLGAEMFIRAYPDLQPNYAQQPELFHRLWEDAIKEQKDMKVIWCLGFRGQGDCPFWSNDTSGRFNTPAKRGKLISEVIEVQRQMVKKYIKEPVFCTNLYGEIMELYNEGHIALDEEIVKVSADNGYGKMVTRRRDNHTVRISSIPKEVTKHGGIYYHVSFYDLQAANHITMLPNSIDFVDRELTNVIEKNMTDYWLINCSNVRPHTYYLDAIRRKWYGEKLSDELQSKAFVEQYFNKNHLVAECLRTYPKAMISYGIEEDEHAGEQFYTENIRILVNQFIRDRYQTAQSLQWLTGEIALSKQVARYCSICEAGIKSLKAYYYQCQSVSKQLSEREGQLFNATILLQAKLHYECALGVVLFGKAYKQIEEEHYLEAFLTLGDSAMQFDLADAAMRKSEYGVWQGFYFNECFADVKHTAYMVRKMMGIVREWGDNVRHDKWYREVMYAKEDRGVFSLLVNDNHMTDWELYEAFKNKNLLD